jgi:hypothetical protein
MPPRSSISRLPSDVKASVDKLIREDVTIDEIVAHLEKLGEDVSRSAVGRYRKNAEATMRNHREAQEVAGVWVEQLGENPKGDVGRLCAEMLKTVAYQTLSNMGEREETDVAVASKNIAYLSKSMKDLASADKLSLDREERIRDAALAAAAKKVDSVVKNRGLTAEDAAAIRAQILGVGDGRS